jgi:hypothetical protein
MQKIIIGAALTIIICWLFILMTDMIIGDTTHTDNKSASERAGSTAMDKAVKVGVLRAQEEIAIEPDIAKKEFEKSYKQNATFKDPASKREFSVHAVHEQPAMIAVEGGRRKLLVIRNNLMKRKAALRVTQNTYLFMKQILTTRKLEET